MIDSHMTTDGKGDRRLREASDAIQALISAGVALQTADGRKRADKEREWTAAAQQGRHVQAVCAARAPSALPEAAKPGGELRDGAEEAFERWRGTKPFIVTAREAFFAGYRALTAPPREDHSGGVTDMVGAAREESQVDLTRRILALIEPSGQTTSEQVELACAIAATPGLAPTPPKDAGALEAARGARETLDEGALSEALDRAWRDVMQASYLAPEVLNMLGRHMVHHLQDVEREKALAEVEEERS